MAEIYAIFSARDGKVRYVGKTLGSRLERFEQHKKCQIGRVVSAVYSWIWSELRHGYPVQCVRLEVCSDDICLHIEMKWINRFPDLLNERKYYSRRCHAPVIPEIKDYMRSHRANCGGFRGIFWWGRIDCYSVLKPNGEWLLGDAAPGRGGDIYFPDRTAGIKARDAYREHSRYIDWLPDTEEEFDWAAA